MIIHITQLLPLIYAAQPPRNPTLSILGVPRLTHITYYTILSLYSNIEQPWMYSFLGTQLGVFHISGRILLHITYNIYYTITYFYQIYQFFLHLLHSQHFCRFIAICYIFYMLCIAPSCKQTYIRCRKMHVCYSFSKGVSPWVFHVDACQLSGSGGCQHCPLGSWCRQVLRLRLGYPVANGGS